MMVLINDINKIFQNEPFVEEINVLNDFFCEVDIHKLHFHISKSIQFFRKVAAVQPYYICLRIREVLEEKSDKIDLELERLYPALIESIVTYLQYMDYLNVELTNTTHLDVLQNRKFMNYIKEMRLHPNYKLVMSDGYFFCFNNNMRS